MKASFLGRVVHNHTAFIRIKTNKDSKQEMLILPVEVEVTSGELYLLWNLNFWLFIKLFPIFIQLTLQGNQLLRYCHHGA